MSEHQPGSREALRASKNTDRELWREPGGDAYADSVHVTADGYIGMNVGGTVVVKPIRAWVEASISPHRIAVVQDAIPSRSRWPMANRSERNAMIVEFRSAGATQQQIADRLGVSQQRISEVLRPAERVGGMPCPTCGSGSKTIKTLPPAKAAIRRRHWCKACGHVWTSTQRND